MFEQAIAVELEHPHRTWTTLAGMGFQLLLLTAAVLAPLVSPEVLPRTRLFETLIAPPRPPAAPPGRAVRIVDVQRAPRPTQIIGNRLIAPRPEAIPAKPVLIDEPPLIGAEAGMGAGTESGVAGGTNDGVPNAIVDFLARQAPVPKPPAAAPAPKPAAPQIPRIKIGGHVLASKLIRQVMPVYPPLARQARVQGDVELMGIVGTDGQIRQLQVIKGHPLLARAALDAVRQWLYSPTYLNGDPVEVIAPITVSFKLNP